MSLRLYGGMSISFLVVLGKAGIPTLFHPSMSNESDLQNSRATSSLDTSSLTSMLYRGYRVKATRDKIRKVIESDPAFDKTKRPFQSRNQRMTSSIAALRRIFELKRDQQWTVRLPSRLPPSTG